MVLWWYLMLYHVRISPWFLFIAICKIRCNLHSIWDLMCGCTILSIFYHKVVLYQAHILQSSVRRCTISNTSMFFLQTLLSTLMKNVFRFQSRWQEMTEIPRFHFLAGWDVNVTSASFLSSDYKSSSSSRESFEKCQWLSPNGFPYLRRSK